MLLGPGVLNSYDLPILFSRRQTQPAQQYGEVRQIENVLLDSSRRLGELDVIVDFPGQQPLEQIAEAAA